MAYPMQLRQRVVAAKDRGLGTKRVAELFEVSESWVRRLKQYERERGDIVPRPCGGSSPKLGPVEHEQIHAHFAAHPDTTIAELKEALGTDVGEVTVWRTARGLGYRFKKSRSTPPSKSGRT